MAKTKKPDEKQSLTYTGDGVVRVHLKDGSVFEFTKNVTAKRGEIPNDAFRALSVRPDFGASLEEYRASRAHYVAPAPNDTKETGPETVVPRAATNSVSASVEK